MNESTHSVATDSVGGTAPAKEAPTYFESVMMTPTERRYAVFSPDGRLLFYTSSVLAARMFMAGKDTNLWSGS